MSLFTAQSVRGVFPTQFSWNDLKMGGGGYCRGLDMHSDGTMVTKVDVYGAYIGNTTPGTVWRQLITTNTMPASFTGTGNAQYPFIGAGVYDIRIAPTNSNILYMMYQAFPSASNLCSIFVSTDKGNNWVQTTNTTLKAFTADPNGPFGYSGQSLAIDPNNSAVCYVGTPSNGLWVTTNTGSTWTQISTASVQLAQGGTGYFGLAFDATSGTTGGKTNKIFVPVYNKGFYTSTDAGATFSLSTGAPTFIGHAKVGVDGTYYCISSSSPVPGSGGSLWRLSKTGTWTSILTPASLVACDPGNKDNLVASDNGGYLNFSANSTTTTPTWAGYSEANNGNGQPSGNAGAHFINATDVPWIQNAQDYSLSEGDLWFDPSVSQRLWFAWGCSVLYTSTFVNPPVGGQQQWFSQTAGIENLVVNSVCWPPTGIPIVVCWDRPFWRITDPNAYPSNYGPIYNLTQGVQYGSAVDYASNNASFLAGISTATASGGAKSSDGGITWTDFTGSVPGTSGNGVTGNIVACDSTHFVVVRGDNSGIYNTTDGGATWNIPSVVPASNYLAFGTTSSVVLTKDTTNNHILVYNQNGNLYLSTDKGVTWALKFTGPIDANDNFYLTQLKYVPGQAGNLFYSLGQTEDFGSPYPNGKAFHRSTTDGASWSVVSNVQDVITFGFGAPKNSGGYPSIALVGWVSLDGGSTYNYGIWRSDDNCTSWTKIGDFPPRPSINSGTGGWIDEITCISGNPISYNRWIVGFQGSSCAYYGPGTI